MVGFAIWITEDFSLSRNVPEWTWAEGLIVSSISRSLLPFCLGPHCAPSFYRFPSCRLYKPDFFFVLFNIHASILKSLIPNHLHQFPRYLTTFLSSFICSPFKTFPLAPFSAACMHVGVGPSTGAQVASQDPSPEAQLSRLQQSPAANSSLDGAA